MDGMVEGVEDLEENVTAVEDVKVDVVDGMVMGMEEVDGGLVELFEDVVIGLWGFEKMEVFAEE